MLEAGYAVVISGGEVPVGWRFIRFQFVGTVNGSTRVDVLLRCFRMIVVLGRLKLSRGWVAPGFWLSGYKWLRVLAVGMTGGGCDTQVVGPTGVAPAVVFFALVTSDTQPGGVVIAGGPTVLGGLHMVSVLGFRVTAWGATNVIAQQDHPT